MDRFNKKSIVLLSLYQLWHT